MRSVTDLIEHLKHRYEGSLPFKRICQDESIIVAKAPLDRGVNSLFLTDGKHKIIILNQSLSYWERREHSWHELWHCMKSPITATQHQNKKEEDRAKLFAALVRAPEVKEGDTVDSIMERYNVTPALARIRLDYELKQNGRG